MSFWTNLFSGKTYSRMGSTIVDQDGKTFTKIGDNWLDNQNHNLIQRQGKDLVNLDTGVRSSFGDPFSNDKEW